MNRMHINGLFMFGFYIKTTRKPAFWNRVITIQNQLSSFSLCLTEVLAFPRCRQASNFVFLLQFLSPRDKECMDLLRECCIWRIKLIQMGATVTWQYTKIVDQECTIFQRQKSATKAHPTQPIGCVGNSFGGQTVSWLHRRHHPSRTEQFTSKRTFTRRKNRPSSVLGARRERGSWTRPKPHETSSKKP